MRPGRVVALVIGCLLVLPGLGALLGGAALSAGYAFGRDDDGFFELTLDRIESATVAVSAEDIELTADPGSPDWLIDALDADVRLRATNADERAVFLGIGPEAAVDEYLAGVAHDQLIRLDRGDEPVYRSRAGADRIDLPTEQDFWAASASGVGTQELLWEADSGRWAAVVMNADGSPGIAADVEVGVRAGFLLPLALALLGVGVVLTAVAVVLIIVGARGHHTGDADHSAGPPVATTAATSATAPATPDPPVRTPVVLEATLDPDLSRWQWLVKWFLAIPHFVVLVFLWIAFGVLTVVAGVAILFTGRYPQGIFDFNLGVLRWTWRVTYYATGGGIGTDRYPPFSLGPEPDYPATLDIERPGELSRGLVLVKWWLLALPHYLVVGVLIGGTIGWGDDFEGDGAGLLAVLVLIAGVILLFRGRYPRSLFDLIIGCNRWIYRVVAYAALMTDDYPPFRLDQGGADPRAVAPRSDMPAPDPQITTRGGESP